MQKLSAGISLHATGILSGDYFEAAELFVYQHDDTGSAAFISNRLFPRKLDQLLEFASGKPLDIWEGGPVDQQHLFFLHRRPDMISGGTPVTGNIFLGGDFTHALALVNNANISAADLRIFIGYCGWEAGGLEAEISEGSWSFTAGTPERLFK